METLLSREGLIAVITALAGLLLFGLAPYLPSVFPPSIIRLLGFGCVVLACLTIVMLGEFSQGILPSALLGAGCLIIMALIHLAQAKRGKE